MRCEVNNLQVQPGEGMGEWVRPSVPGGRSHLGCHHAVLKFVWWVAGSCSGRVGSLIVCRSHLWLWGLHRCSTAAVSWGGLWVVFGMVVWSVIHALTDLLSFLCFSVYYCSYFQNNKFTFKKEKTAISTKWRHLAKYFFVCFTSFLSSCQSLHIPPKSVNQPII